MIRARRAIAVCTALLWLLAVEVLPSLHEATHDRHHTHTHDGTIVSQGHDDQDAELDRLHQLAHAQSGRPCTHQRSKPQRDLLAFQHAPSGHDAAGIAHRAAALLDPPPPITTPLAMPIAEPYRHVVANDVIGHAPIATAIARGPPLA